MDCAAAVSPGQLPAEQEKGESERSLNWGWGLSGAPESEEEGLPPGLPIGSPSLQVGVLPGSPWSLTCAGARPVFGTHEAPHGVVSGVAVFPVEAVPASCGHSHHLRVQRPGTPAHTPLPPPLGRTFQKEQPPPAALGFLQVVAVREVGGAGGQRGLPGLAPGPKGSFHLSPGPAGRTGAPAARPPQSAPAPPAATSPGRWRSWGGDGRRGAAWSVENPHGPPRAGPAVTSAPAAGRGRGLRRGPGSSWDAQRLLERERRAGALGSGKRAWRGAGAAESGSQPSHRGSTQDLVPRAVASLRARAPPAPPQAPASRPSFSTSGWRGVTAAPQVLLSHLRPLPVPPAGWDPRQSRQQ